MYGYYYSDNLRNSNVASFSPLDYNPTFWFDYNQYSTGVLGSETDRTGNYTTTNVNGIEVSSFGGINSLDCVLANSSAANYGADFNSIIAGSHTHVFVYAPKDVNPASSSRVLWGVRKSSNLDQFTFLQYENKLRLFVSRAGVSKIFNTTGVVFTNTDYKIITLRVSQGTVKINVNGVDMPLDITNFGAVTLANLDYAPVVPYVGARNDDGTLNIPTNGYIGDHLLFNYLLNADEVTEIENYFV